MQARAPTAAFEDAIDAAVPSASLHGKVCGDWRAVELVGRGGTAEVWRGVDAVGREVALKVVRADLGAGSVGDDLLLRELKLLRLVASPLLVEPLGVVDWSGRAALVLEYLPGGDLVPLLGAPRAQWWSAFKRVLAAVGALHACGFAHGDIKARNVLFGADGKARLIDLTGARTLASEPRRATPAYRAPGAATAEQADAFALAALLYELLSGRWPFGAQGTAQLGRRPPAIALAEPQSARLLDAAVAVLQAGGRSPHGIAHLADVIELAN